MVMDLWTNELMCILSIIFGFVLGFLTSCLFAIDQDGN